MSLFWCCAGLVLEKPEGLDVSTINNFSAPQNTGEVHDVFLSIKEGTPKEGVLLVLKEMAAAIEAYDPTSGELPDFHSRFMEHLKKPRSAEQ